MAGAEPKDRRSRGKEEPAGLSRTQLADLITTWMESWNAHDLTAVMALFAEEAVFEAWTGTIVRGKSSIRRVWTAWFKNHGNFKFETRKLIVDEWSQSVALAWTLDWPNPERAHGHEREERQGVDLLQFSEGMIVSKKSFCQTVVSVSERS